VIKNIGTTELIIIALILILLFGGKKIPEFIKGVGEAVKEFKKASKDDK
jgi:sec-independent protein translocase protein TatA